MITSEIVFYLILLLVFFRPVKSLVKSTTKLADKFAKEIDEMLDDEDDIKRKNDTAK